MRSLWLAKKKGKNKALRWVKDENVRVKTEVIEVTYADGVTRKVRRPLLEIFEPKSAKDVKEGTVARGSATCPVTGFTTPVASVRKQLKSRLGGANDARLFCVVVTKTGQQGRFYRLPTDEDLFAVKKASEELGIRKKKHTGELSLVPDEILDVRGIRHTWAMIYGIEKWGDCFTPRQSLSIITLLAFLQKIVNFNFNNDINLSKTTQICLTLAVDRIIDQISSLVSWVASIEVVTHTFTRQALPMIWDFVEPNPFGGAGGDFGGAVNWVLKVIEHISALQVTSGQVENISATESLLPNDSANAIITDPPYYDAVPYSYLSDYFYVWLRRSLFKICPEIFKDSLVPKNEEIIVDRPHELSNSKKDITFYEQELTKAFANSVRVLRPDSIGTIVFASKTTASWEAILKAVVDAGWIITGSWSIDTERGARVSAQGQARLASSIHLVCRPRNCNEIGDWRDVLQELPQRIHVWMPRLASEGVVGADAIFACLGPALEIFSRYSSVEKASGEQVTLKEYLEYVWAAVSKEALSMIFSDIDATGLEEDARLTAMWLWTLSTGTEGQGSKSVEEIDEIEDDEEENNSKSAKISGFVLEFDAARKIAQGLGAHLETLATLVEIKGDKARLLPVQERSRYLLGKGNLASPSKGKKKGAKQLTLEGVINEAEQKQNIDTEIDLTNIGKTTLDRIHQTMLLFAAGRSEAIKRFLVDEGVGTDERFWKLAQALSALYPPATDEKRWVDGVLARKKGIGF